MFKKVFWVLSILVALSLAAVGFVFFDMINNNDQFKTKVNTEATNTKKEEVKINNVKWEVNLGSNPFETAVTVEMLNDANVQRYIHYMSHQKVRATDKRGYYLITEERINWVLQVLDEREFQHEEIYRDILERWKGDDFSKVDKDHNAIWKMQGGIVGKATGILSPKEEEDYINSMEELKDEMTP